MAAQEGPGNFCLDGPNNPHGPAGSCTANDGGISSFTAVSITDRCTDFTSDTGTATFRVAITSGSARRYDFGIFIDTSGASGEPARSGSSCYHDFLPDAQVGINPPDGPPYLNANSDNDFCGDLDPNQTWVRTTQSITFNCRDTDNDGRADLHTCASWDNNRGTTCSGIAGAYPDNGSKCRCARYQLFGPLAVDLTNFEAAADGMPQWLPLALMLLAAAAFSGLVWSRRRQQLV